MKQKKNGTWESLGDIEERVKDAQKSINNWIFFVTLEIGAAVGAIIVKTVTTAKLEKSGDSAAIMPSLYEMTEGKKIDAGKMAGVLTEKIKENLSLADAMETFSTIPQSIIGTSVIIFVATLLVLVWKTVKKKNIQQELEDKRKETRANL